MKKIAVIDQWPQHTTAERECIERIRRAAAGLGVEVAVLDKFGRDLETGREVDRESVEFVISLHFESPKCFDAHTYVVLWNPISFYFWWGYQWSTRNLASHDDSLSCGSITGDDQIARLIRGDASRRHPVFTLNPSLSEPVIAPEVRGDRRVFYCGINWERLGKGPGRHEEVLKILDQRDAVRVYGPDLIDGVKVWDGFRNYAGPIPFDGVSCVRELARCGVALGFSSDAHRQSAMLSNRLFEAAAAGAVIICDGNPFAREHFGDALLYVDTDRPQAEVAAQVLDRLDWINAHPRAAADLAARAQAVFLEKFCLKRQLSALLEGHPARAAALAEAYQARTRRHPVRLIHHHDRHDTLEGLRALAEDVRRQTYPVARLDVVADAAAGGPAAAELAAAASAAAAAGCEVQVHALPLSAGGRRIAAFGEAACRLAAEGPEGELVCLSTGAARLFADHVSSLVRKFEDDPALKVAVSDVLLRHFDPAGAEHRDLHPVRSAGPLRDLAVHRVSEHCLVRLGDLAAEFGPVLRYLDDALPYALARAAGDAVAYTRRPTTMRHLRPSGGSCLPLDQQFDLIADSFLEAKAVEKTEPAPSVVVRDVVQEIAGLGRDGRRHILVGLARSGMPPRVERLARWMYRKVRRAA